MVLACPVMMYVHSKFIAGKVVYKFNCGPK